LRWEQWQLPALVQRIAGETKIDALYSPALGAPLRHSVPQITHVHDLIPLRFPAQFGGFAGWYWKDLLPLTWRGSNMITVSNDSIADDL
jgi:hypothetical protein